MTFDEFFAEAKRLKCRMVSDDPADVRAAMDAKDAEIERLRATLAQSCDEHRSQMYEAGPGGGCVLLVAAVAAERERCALLANTWAGYFKDFQSADEFARLVRLGPNVVVTGRQAEARK